MPLLCKLQCSGTSSFILSLGSFYSSGLMTPNLKTDGNHRRGRHAKAARTHCVKTGSKPATRLIDVLRQRPETSGVWLYLATFACQNKCRTICSSFPVLLPFKPDSRGHFSTAHTGEEGNEAPFHPAAQL